MDRAALGRGILTHTLHSFRKGRGAITLSHVYVMGDDGGTNQLQRIACSDEDKELQRLLERNLNLLPGDQISPGQSLQAGCS